jgi:glycine C-acetyltransferase
MYNQLQPFLVKELEAIKAAGLYKKERIITSAQAAAITIQGGQQVLNFCANN